MAMYKICSHCGKHIEYNKQCECVEKYKKDKYKLYKNKRQDKKEQSFYSSSTWIKCRDNIKAHYFGFCLVCWHRDKNKKGNNNNSELIHHIVEIKEDYEKRLDEDNLTPLCDSCHTKVHKLYDKDIKTKKRTQEWLKELIKEFNQDYY